MMPCNCKTEMNKRKKQTNVQEKEAWKKEDWSFIFNFYSEQLRIQRSEYPEIVQKCFLWESEKRCQKGRFPGVSPYLFPSILPLPPLNFPVLPFTFRSGEAPAGGTGLKAVTAVLDH